MRRTAPAARIRPGIRVQLVVILTICLSIALPVAPAAAAAVTDCSSMATPIHHRINPSTQSNLLTPWPTEAASAGANYGFTDDRGTPFRAAIGPAAELVPVHRLFRASTENFFWGADPTEIANATARYGYEDQGVDFYASRVPGACLLPVYRFRQGDMHRHATSDRDRADLAATGWLNEGVVFYGASTSPAPPPSTPAPPPATPAPPATPPATPTPPPPAPTPLPPTGNGIVAYEALPSKGSMPATVNAVTPAAEVSFRAGTFEFSDFAMGVNAYGFLAWLSGGVGPKGLRGSGPDSTVFRMRAGTSTQAGRVPPQSAFATGGTNPLYLMRADASTVLSGFSLVGTDQGHLYNGLNLYQGSDARLANLAVRGIPGDNSANPGETFGINLYRNVRTQMDAVEIDGRNAAGARVGASGLGINYGTDLVCNDLYVHDIRYGHAVAAYTTANLTFNRPRFVDNVQAMNFERVSGSVAVNRPYFRNNVENGAINYHLTIANDQGSGSFTIVDPDFDGPKLRVRVSGYLGNPRTQDPAAVKLIVNGQERPDLMELRIQTY